MFSIEDALQGFTAHRDKQLRLHTDRQAVSHCNRKPAAMDSTTSRRQTNS